MHSDRISLLIQKLRDQTASTKEKEELAAYLSQQDTDIDSLLSWRDWEEVSAERMPSGLRDRIATTILEKDGRSEERRLAGRRQRMGRIRVMGLTAAAVVFLAIALPWWFSSQSNRRLPASITQRAARGQSKMVVLPDHSKVYLNGGSSITYPAVFDDSDRQVALAGEAFFDVAMVAGQPFKVRTGSLLTTVLGTSFNVKAYKEYEDRIPLDQNEENVVVAVKTGKVKVDEEGGLGKGVTPCVLLPGQQISYGGRNHPLVLQTVAVDKIAAWQNNELLFDGSPLKEILQTLENRYNVRLESGPGVKLDEKYSITFYHLNLQETLDKIAFLGGLKFSRLNDSLIRLIPIK